MFTAALRSAAGSVYRASPHFLAHLTGKVIILMYHRVVPREEAATTFVQPGMYVTPASFEAHLRYLSSHFELLAFDELLTRWHTGDWNRNARYCVITFDDGWLDNYRYAYPLLREFEVPATVFLPTALIGTGDWLWSDRLGYVLHRLGRGRPEEWDAYIERAKLLADDVRSDLIARLATRNGIDLPKQRRFVNWNEVREMSHHRVSFGAHSRTHAILTRLADDALGAELREPLDVLRAQRVHHVPVLAYPNGDHSARVVAAARAAGYQAAVTTAAGVRADQPGDLFRLPRIGLHEDVTASAPLLALHVARQLRSRSHQEESA